MTDFNGDPSSAAPRESWHVINYGAGLAAKVVMGMQPEQAVWYLPPPAVSEFSEQHELDIPNDVTTWLKATWRYADFAPAFTVNKTAPSETQVKTFDEVEAELPADQAELLILDLLTDS